VQKKKETENKEQGKSKKVKGQLPAAQSDMLVPRQ
jgi:hypothetical protein